MFPGYKLYLTPTSDNHLHQPDSLTESDDPVELRSNKSGGNPELAHDAGCEKVPLIGDRGNCRPLTDRLSFSPIAEEKDPMELQSKDSGGSSEIGDNAQSERDSHDGSNISPGPAHPSLDSLLAIFLTFCLIFCVHLYVHPLYMNGLQSGSSTQEHLDRDNVQVLRLYEAGNNSFLDSHRTQMQNSRRESDPKALHTPRNDEAERARWEVVRDWLDHILDGRQSQGYA